MPQRTTSNSDNRPSFRHRNERLALGEMEALRRPEATSGSPAPPLNPKPYKKNQGHKCLGFRA